VHVPRVFPPSQNFELGHLTFVGVNKFNGDNGFFSANSLKASELNRLAKKYSIDTYITLFDLGQIANDVEFTLPVVGWVPLHSPGVSRAGPEIWSLRSYHAVASLSPSSSHSIKKVLPEIPVEYVPHIILREELESSARRGLEEIRAAESTGSSTYSNSKIFSEDDETFVVLLQGGNYDSQDRKGWDTSIQAFAKFYLRYSAEGKTPNVHLYIHALESYLIESDLNNREKAPPAVMPEGVNLSKRIYETGLPREAYTIDITQHEPEIVAALKSKADVCLHASKVEGFGMNVLECQALGTPVITTNHTAMGDFTKLGISVGHQQMIFPSGSIGYDFALPDVNGIANALREIYEDHLSTRTTGEDSASGDLSSPQPGKYDYFDAQKWIDLEFSTDRVGNAFLRLIDDAEQTMDDRENKRRAVVATGCPDVHTKRYFALVQGEHPELADWDEPFTVIAPEGMVFNEKGLQSLLCGVLDIDQSDIALAVIPAIYEDSRSDIPLVGSNGMVHPHIPVVVRTSLLAMIQNSTSRRSSIVYLAIQHAQSVGAMKRFPDGLAFLSPAIKAQGSLQEL